MYLSRISAEIIKNYRKVSPHLVPASHRQIGNKEVSVVIVMHRMRYCTS